MKKVLHMDDQPEILLPLVEMFKYNDIELILCSNPKEFADILLREHENIGAVILDVLNADLDDDDHNVCLEMSKRYHLPIFTYTGQPDVLGNNLYRKTLDNLYVKSDPKELYRLIEDVTEALSEKTKNDKYVTDLYPQLFSHIERIGSQNLSDMVKRYMRSFIFEEDRELRPTTGLLRLIYEPVFLYLRDNGLLPDACFSAKDNKANCSDILRYLNGECTKFKNLNKCTFGVIDLDGPVLPVDLINLLRRITHSSGRNLHYQESDSYSMLVNEYVEQSNFMGLCAVLVYLVDYVLSHPSYEMNRNRCYNLQELIDSHVKPSEDEDGNLFIGKCLITQPFEKNLNRYELVKNKDSITSAKYPLLLIKKREQE